MRQIERLGRTVEEAILLGLQDLQVDRENVEIEVLDEGNKGIFGLFGSKECKVRLTVKDEIVEKANNFLKDVFSTMGLSVEIESNLTPNALEIVLNGDKVGTLIGRHGEVLDALQHLVSVVVNKDRESYLKVILDSENYRRRREETLIRLANKLAARVARDRKNVTLEPMSAYERRIIHAALQNNKYVETNSIGEEPNRRIVITYKK